MASPRLITFQGKTQSLRAWAREFGCHHETLAYRLKVASSVDEAFTTPPQLAQARALILDLLPLATKGAATATERKKLAAVMARLDQVGVRP